MGSEPGHEGLGVSRQNVHHTAGNIAGGENLGKADCRERLGGVREHHSRVPAGENRSQHRTETQKTLTGFSGGRKCHHHTRGFGSGEVEVGASDRVSITRNLGILVGKPGVPDPGVDGLLHLLLRRLSAHALAGSNLLHKLVNSALKNLRDPIQNLATVIGREPRKC